MRLIVKLTIFLAPALLSAAACSPGPSSAPEQGVTEGTTQATNPVEQTTTRRVREVIVEQIAEGQSGPAERGVVVAGSAAELAAATGLEAPESGEGLYVSAQAGERPTGGYEVSVSGAAGGRVQVGLREPDEGAIVTQALTQPYAVAVVRAGRGSAPAAGELSFVDSGGDHLGWPVRLVGSSGG